MQESIHAYFQVGTVLWMSFPTAKYDYLRALRSVATDDFFDAVEICQIHDEQLRKETKSILMPSHLTVGYGASTRLLGTGLNPNDINEESRQKAEDTLLAGVDEARDLGAKGIVFLAGKWQPDAKENAYAQLIKTTENVCRYAAQYDMFVELEVFDYDMDKAALIGPAPLAARFAADMRCRVNNFGLLVDLSHFPTTYETSKFVIQALRPYITHLHIGNAVVQHGSEAYGDQHPRFGFPNSANDVAELTDFFNVLLAEGMLNVEKPMILSMEVKPWGDEDCEIVLAGTKRVINRAWALAGK